MVAAPAAPGPAPIPPPGAVPAAIPAAAPGAQNGNANPAAPPQGNQQQFLGQDGLPYVPANAPNGNQQLNDILNGLHSLQDNLGLDAIGGRQGQLPDLRSFAQIDQFNQQRGFQSHASRAGVYGFPDSRFPFPFLDFLEKFKNPTFSFSFSRFPDFRNYIRKFNA